MDYGKEFMKYGVKHMGIGSHNLDQWSKNQVDAMTPYILEERDMRFSQLDIFSRLMKDRLIWINTGISDSMSSIVQAQLMFLDSVNQSDITLHVDSPGGSVKSGLSIIDVMEYVSCDINTVNTGMCASMGAVILGAGTKGKRSSLKYSRTMIHQSSGGAGGHILDAEITWNEWIKVNEQLFKMLSEYTGKTPEQIKLDANRDLWLSAHESVEYGIIDEVILSKKKKKDI